MQARWLTLYLGALLAVMPALTSSSEAAFPGRNGRIAAGGMFLAGGCGEWGAIATMEPDGTRRRSLGCRSRGQFSSVNGPDWSPDGRRLLYYGNGLPARVMGDGQRPRVVPLGIEPSSY